MHEQPVPHDEHLWSKATDGHHASFMDENKRTAKKPFQALAAKASNKLLNPRPPMRPMESKQELLELHQYLAFFSGLTRRIMFSFISQSISRASNNPCRATFKRNAWQITDSLRRSRVRIGLIATSNSVPILL